MSVAFLSSKFTQELPRRIHRLETDTLRIEVRQNTRHRWLTFGNGIVQSAMSLAAPHELVLAYTQSMMAPLIFNDQPQRIVCLGVGGGSFIRHFRHTLPEAAITAIDASQAVVDTAHAYFELPPPDARLRVTIEDAKTAVTTLADQDLVLVDVFDEQGMPAWIGAPDFLIACRDALRENGILAVNLMPHDDAGLAEFLSVLRHTFLGRVLVTTLVDYRNVIAFALAGPPAELAVASLGARAVELERRLKLPLGRVFRNICGVNVCHGGKLVI